MKRIVMGSVLLAGLASAAAAAQEVKGPAKMPSKPPASGGMPGKVNGGGNPRSIAQAATQNKMVTLSVTYPAISGTHAIISGPNGALSCALPAIGGLFTYRCTLTAPSGATVALKAVWFKSTVPANNGYQVAGAQWKGDCVATIGDTCTLVMDVDKAVIIDPSAPGGMPRPMGTTQD